MKFRVEREALGEAVTWVARALPSRPVVPVLSGLLLQAGDDALTLSCFDYEVSARAQVDAKVEETGGVLVPGRLLADITRSLPPADVDVTSGGDMTGLICGPAEFELISLPLEEYPALPEPPEPAGTVDGAGFAAAVAQVVCAASRDDSLPMLTAVSLETDGETLTLAATDRYRLAVRRMHWEPAAPRLRAATLVPARTLSDVARTMSGEDVVTVAFGSGPDQAGTGDGLISFAGGSRRFTARPVAGEFIRYESRFPAEFGSRAVMSQSFTEAVRRVSLAADRSSPVQLTFSADRVLVEARTEGRARAREAVLADFEGGEKTISFSPQHLLDGLAGACAGAEADAQQQQISIEFSTPARPALITRATGQGAEPGQAAFRYLLAPLRVTGRA